MRTTGSARVAARLRRGTAVVAVLSLVAGLAACGGKSSDQNGGGSNPPPIGKGPLTPEQRYGEGPVKDPNVTLQPDVVLVDGGPKAIKEASGNGTSWTLDGHAGGVKDLAPGKILFASRLAVGRVVTVENVGDDRKVQLAPVQLTDIVRDGTFKVDQPVNLDAMTAQYIPDLPYAYTVLPKKPQTEESDEPDDPESEEPAGGGAPTGVVPGTRAASGHPAAKAPAVRSVTLPEVKLSRTGRGLPNPVNLDNESVKAQLGDWELTPFRSKAGLGLRAFYAGAASGLKGGVTLSLDYVTPKVKAELPISGGAVSPATFVMTGLNKLSIKVNLGSGGGLRDNQRLRLEVPYDLAADEILVAGIPMATTLKFKMIIELGFSSKNSTAQSLMEYKISGPMGTISNQPIKPAVSKANDPGDATQNLSLAPFGLVIAYEIKWLFGPGIPQFLGGIYVKWTVSMGLWSEGTMGATHCEAGQVSGEMTVGLGYSLSSKAQEYWTKYLGGLGKSAKLTKLEQENQLLKVPLFKFPWARPNSAHCNLMNS